MIDKIISSEQKKDLRILIEDFLEKDKKSLSEQSEVGRGGKTGTYIRIYRILSRNIAPTDIPDVSDLTDAELTIAAIEWYQLLKPIWKNFKKVLFDYKETVLPERKSLETPISGFSETSSPLYEYKELQDNSYIPVDKFYPVKIRGASFKLTLSFDSGVIAIFRKDLNPVNSFIDIMKNVPIELFAKCEYCKKVIILTRSGKKNCFGCASKAYQKELWKNNPEGAREREKKRYQEKRKRE